MTRDAAGYMIRGSESKIARMELGRVGFKERDVTDLLDLCQVTDPIERQTILGLARQANAPAWWHQYHDILPPWFQNYLGLEGAATTIRTYEVQFVPGLLQTADYADAVVRLGHGRDAPADIRRRVQLRIDRQQILHREAPPAPHVHAILDEAALRRPMGNLDVLREQIQFLVDLTELPNISLQILPFHMGGSVAAGGAFTVVGFQDHAVPDVVYVEQLAVDRRAG
ncbi:helix-turn-helix transcriptional regulator [Virgisporangium aurantiacum]